MTIKDSDVTNDSSEAPGIAPALRQDYLREILAGKRQSALQTIMDAYRGGYSIPGIYMDIFQETLYEIGRLWETNQISVAEEHMGTAITQFVMSNLYQHLDRTHELRGNIVITTVQGELHQVGANMVADILEADGWNVLFLGSSVPTEGIMQSIKKHNADLFGVSSTMVFNIPRVVDLAEAVRNEFGDSVRIILGGSAFRGLKQLPPKLEGCTVALDLRQALEQTRSDISEQQ